MRVAFNANRGGGGGIVALDLGSRSGWAMAPLAAVAAWPAGNADPKAWEDFRKAAGKQVLLGSNSLAGGTTDLGKHLSALDSLVSDLVTIHAPAALVWEAPLVSGSHSGGLAAIKAFGAHGLASLIAHRRQLAEGAMHVSTVKKAWTGDGRAKKPMMIQTARLHGFDTPKLDEHAADALAVLHTAITKHALRPMAQAANGG